MPKRGIKKFFVLAVIVVIVIACALVIILYERPTVSLEEKIERIVEDMMKAEDIPGAIVGVWAPDKIIWIEAKGKADLETGEYIKRTDKMRIGSVTKTFVATVVLQLVQEGKLTLQDTLDNFVPTVPDAKVITIRQLLNHTSGLYNFTEDEYFDRVTDHQPLKEWTDQELVNIAISHEPYFAPGKGYHYSNTNYVLLGMIAEQVTGKKIGEEIEERIIKPLALMNTSYPTEPSIKGEYSHGYKKNEETGKLDDVTVLNPSAVGAAGAMISNLQDLKIWVKALAKGELLSAETQKERLTWVRVPMKDNKYVDGYDYGLGICRVVGFLGHNGQINGYNTAMYYLSQKDATIIVLLNKSNEISFADFVFAKIAKELFPELDWKK